MSSSKCVPPNFITDASQYAEYKKKLLRWSRITKTDPAQKADMVLYHLEGHPSGIQEKIDTALGDSIIEKPDGLEKLIAYLDSIYLQDEMVEMWEKYKQFVRLKKGEGQLITEFIAAFESAYKEAKDNGCEVSDTVLALNLLDSCCLSETDEKFVLTGIDFKKGKENGDCLEQVKKSLRKYQSRERVSGDRLSFDGDAEVYVKKESLLAEGWRPPPASNDQDGKLVRKKGLRNKLGADGKPLKCFKCGSEYHFGFHCDQEASSGGVQSVKKQSPPSSSSKAKKKAEPTMLSTLLSSKKYAMVCEVGREEEVPAADNDSPATLYDLLTAGDDHSTVVLTTVTTQCSYVIGTSSEDFVEHDDSSSATLYDMLSETDVMGGPSDTMSLHDLLNGESTPETVSVDEANNLVLVSQEEEKLCYLVEEAGSRGVLDSGCSKSVAGVRWVGNYTNAISPEFSKEVKLSQSGEVYQFGGGEKRRSKGSISVPTLIGENRVFITMDVVDAAIPLLIGTNSMKAGKANLNFDTYEATFFGQVVPMLEVGSGHFCITLVSENLLTHIDDVDEREKQVCDVLVAMDSIEVSDLKKLHHYYGHTHPNRLLKFLKNAGKCTDGLRSALVDIENSCESCVRSKRKKPRPKCAIPRADGPDQVLSIDLKEWSSDGKRKRYICYLIDMFSRLTSGAFIRDKQPESIVACILEHWIAKFGVFSCLHSDLGGEISNSTLEDVASKLGIEVTTTASYSPHQNGLNERNHAIVDLMVIRMLESDKHLSPDTALLWAFNAKNSLENHLGFSPFQLHIGKNPRLPSVTTDGPPSFDNDSLSKNFVSHINAMMSARENFIQLQSADSLKTALKSRVHARGHDIREGDLIYYKKSNGFGKNVVWRGPSRVTSVNGKKLFIDSGARLSTVNRDDSVRVGEEFWRADDVETKRIVKANSRKKKTVRFGPARRSGGVGRSRRTKDVSVRAGSSDVRVLPSSSSSSSEGPEDVDDTDEEGVIDAEGDAVTVADAHSDSDVETDPGDPPDLTDTEDGEDDNAGLVTEGRESDASTAENTESACGSVDTEYEDACDGFVSIPCSEVTTGDIISYRIPETGVEEVSRVEQRSSKATGPNKYWFNVVVQGTYERKAVNTKVLLDLKRISSGSYLHCSPVLVVSIPRYLHDEPECKAAKQKELSNWSQFGVFREVDDVGQRTISTSWVLVRKDTGIKARLVIEPDKESIPTDSPTVNKINIKLFYLLAASLGWQVHTADVQAAFLQGSDLDRDVFVRPPKEARNLGKIWQMLKRAYGFVDASRGFYLEVEKILLNLGCKISRYDPAMFIYFNPDDNTLSGLLLTHVDDFIHGSGDDVFHRNVMVPLKQRFKFGSEGEEDFLYVGLHVVQSGNEIVVDQNRYIDDLESPDTRYFGAGVSPNMRLDDEGQSEFRAIVGRIGWIASSTRPDLAYDNLVLSTKLGNATVWDMRLACKTVKKMKADGTKMKFVHLGPSTQWTLQGYGDAGFKSLPDKTSSCGGHVIILTNKEKGLSCVLDWKAKKLKRVVSSSTAAEAIAVNDTLDMMVYVKAVLVELFGDVGKDIPLELATDSRNLHNSVMTSSLVENPRLRTDIAVLKESLAGRELNKFALVSGRAMLADVLTKSGVAGFQLLNQLRTCELVSM